MDVLLSMSVFRRIAEIESFSAVAREMGLSQPTVSKHVAALEQRLDAKLLNRSTRRMSLTDAGRAYYEQCSRILDDIDETEASLGDRQSQLKGTLRIHIPNAFGRIMVMPAIWDFVDRYPDLSLDLMLDDQHVDLVKEGVDVAIRSGRFGDSSLIARNICALPRVVVASPAYLAAHGEPKTPNDLKHHDCINYSLLTTQNEWHFVGPKGIEKVRVSGRLTVNSPEIVRDAVLRGMGVAVSPLWLVEDGLRQGRLKIVLEDHAPTPYQLHAVYPDRRFLPTKVRYIIDHLRRWLAPLGSLG